PRGNSRTSAASNFWISRRMGAIPSVSQAERGAGQGYTGDHVLQLPIGHVPGSGAQPAVRHHLDAVGTAEDLNRVKDAITDELGRFGEVGVDIEHAKPEGRSTG